MMLLYMAWTELGKPNKGEAKMIIDTQEVMTWAKKEKSLFEAMEYTDFNDGIRAGMDLLIGFLEVYEKQLGEEMEKGQKPPLNPLK